MEWRTYTPDGRMLEVEHAGGQWVARCGSTRADGSSALEAITAAVDSESDSIGSSGSSLGAWLADHAARLESEAG
jgi:hypothetical protein